MTTHDKYCQWPRVPCACMDFAAARRDTIVDLLAKVEALPMHEFPEVSTYSGDRTVVMREGLCRLDVLVLIDEVMKP